MPCCIVSNYIHNTLCYQQQIKIFITIILKSQFWLEASKFMQKMSSKVTGSFSYTKPSKKTIKAYVKGRRPNKTFNHSHWGLSRLFSLIQLNPKY